MQAAGDWDGMMTPPPPPPATAVEYVAPAALGTASFVVGILVEAPVAHALLVSAALMGGMAAGTVVRLFARRLRPPRTDG